MKRKRTVEALEGSAIPEASASASRRRATKTGPLYAQVEEFRQFFKDPPDADTLAVALARHAEDKQEEEQQQTASSEIKGQYQGLQFNGDEVNTLRIFIAVWFLRKHLHDQLQLDIDKAPFSTTKEDGGDFNALAMSIEKKIPEMKGITGLALQSMYVEIVQKRRDLEELLETEAVDLWIPTRLSDMALDLVLVEKIYDLQKINKARKEGLVEERNGRETGALAATNTRAANTIAANIKAANTTKAANATTANTKAASVTTANTTAANTTAANTKAANTTTASTTAADTKAANATTANTKAANTTTANTKSANTTAANTKSANTTTANSKAANTTAETQKGKLPQRSRAAMTTQRPPHAPIAKRIPVVQSEDASSTPVIKEEDASETVAQQPPQGSVYVPTLQLVPSIPSQEEEEEPLSDTEVQESFGEERMLEITRMVQELSSEAEEKQATVDTRLQTLETLVQAQQATLQTSLKALPPPKLVTVENKLKTLENVVQTNRAFVEDNVETVNSDLRYVQERAENGQQGLRAALQAMDQRLKTVEKRVAVKGVGRPMWLDLLTDSSDVEGRLDFLEMMVASINTEEDDSNTLRLTRMVQDMSSEVDEKHCNSETRLQTLEVKLQDINRRMKGMERNVKDAVKQMEDTVARLKDLPKK
ncbi:MAG: hypothetical protein J3Q66DRAFT_397674 [Benniella sp.]|nr:MAG: hypothetical protein J3Q66DRAFT_397674 [Benniella sp.]